MLRRLQVAVTRAAIQEVLKGAVSQYITGVPFEAVLEVASQGKGWESVSPNVKARLVRMAAKNRGALKSLEISDLIDWLYDANPEVASKIFDNEVTRRWVALLWREFVEIRDQVLTTSP